MNLTVRYYDRATNEQVEVEVPNDVLEVVVPANPDNRLPALRVTVNTDAVLLDRVGDGARVAGWTYNDFYAEAVSDIGEEDDEAMLAITYECPECGHCWIDQHTSACDAPCPECGTKDITPITYTSADPLA